MSLYEIIFSGSGIDVMASSVTETQVEHIQKLLKIKGYDTIAAAQKELKYINVDTQKADILNFYKMLYSDEVTVQVFDFDFDEILKFNLKDMSAAKDVIPDFDEKYNNSPFILTDYKRENEGILLSVDERKTRFPYRVFESDEVPTIEDFTYSVNYLKSPDNTWTYVNRVFFKGQVLDIFTYTTFLKVNNTLELY
ncbi:MAG: hypothetical protein AB8G11_04545 [Saprospiraceae bacterium]